ncbi:MAG: hypothetical protein EA378_01805 [Phycisphaerales bacterium]|nr:MAG: hypothetical protein EA378_01805 [Phycisphaerales bacterium]
MTTADAQIRQSALAREHAESDAARNPLFGQWLAHGFAGAVALWAVWFITHLPAVRLAPSVAGPILLATLALVLAMGVRGCGAQRGWRIGIGAGLVAALVNLLILGSKLAEQPSGLAEAEAIGRLRPGAGLAALGFLALSGAIGAAAGAVGGSIRTRRDTSPLTPALATGRHDRWLARLALVAAIAVAPLLLIGGLVTSTDSGMAVPDWPGTYGANMFLYPIALMADQRIFLEHTHRLFGSLVGLAMLTLFVSTLAVRPKGWIRAIGGVVVLVAIGLASLAAHLGASLSAGALFPILVALALIASAWLVVSFLRDRAGEAAGALGVLVALQGIAGGVRVTENALGYALLHGVGGQTVFALAVTVAAMLSLAFVRTDEAITDRQRTIARRARTLAIVALACLFIQLIFGATYRHLGASHALWSHVLFAFVVVVLAGIAGAAGTKRDEQDRQPPTAPARWLRRFGMTAMIVVAIQFILGWATLGVVAMREDRGPIPTADMLADAPPVPILEALVTTSHQATGALLLAAVTLTAVWGHRLARAPR